MGHPYYGSPYVDQDLRRLNDAALDLLWRVNPEIVVPVPEWLPAFLDSETHHAAWELMCKLLLILNEFNDLETGHPTGSVSLAKNKIRKTGYPLRYVRDDLVDLQHGLSELSSRLGRHEYRKTGPEIAGRPLSWLAEGAIARAEPILDVMRERDDRGPDESRGATKELGIVLAEVAAK
jgi:hypothetical protein